MNCPAAVSRSVLVLLLTPALLLAACTDDDGEPAGSADGGDGSAATQAAGDASSERDDAAAGQAAQSEDGDAVDGLIGAVEAVVQEARPAVVHITNRQALPPGALPPEEGNLVPAGVGSGVFIDEDGHILTNNHVIAGAESVLVRLTDGREFEAEVVGTDPRTDLAVLRVEGADLPVGSLGSSADLVVGEWVVAIGNALGLIGGPTVTVGVVSAVGRTVQEKSEASGLRKTI